jgi:hypothetical protein
VVSFERGSAVSASFLPCEDERTRTGTYDREKDQPDEIFQLVSDLFGKAVFVRHDDPYQEPPKDWVYSDDIAKRTRISSLEPNDEDEDEDEDEERMTFETRLDDSRDESRDEHEQQHDEHDKRGRSMFPLKAPAPSDQPPKRPFPRPKHYRGPSYGT